MSITTSSELQSSQSLKFFFEKNSVNQIKIGDASQLMHLWYY